MSIDLFSDLNNMKVLPFYFVFEKEIFIGFLNEQISNNEVFLHSYNPNFQNYSTFLSQQQDEEPIFSFLKTEIREVNGQTKYEFTSVELRDVVGLGTDVAAEGQSETFAFTSYELSYIQQELDGIVYAKPIELQISLDEENTTAQRNYVNSIQASQIQYDILSSLGAITSEDAITDSTTTGTTTGITSATGVITDVGGPTATGTRTNILSDGTATRDVTIGSY